MAEFDRELDASGLDCPLPILRARKVLGEMEHGKTLRVISTDRGSLKDFEAFSRQTRHPLLSSSEENGKFVFLLRKN